jgi:hypothetical protein
VHTSTAFDLPDEYIAQGRLNDHIVDLGTPIEMDAQVHVLFKPISEHSLR